jgi:type VI secretion system protein ImpF
MIRTSVLDRLIDAHPDKKREAPQSRAEALAALKASVRRDLEWLLNTRRVAEPLRPELAEVARSVYYYGLPEITHFMLRYERDRRELAGLLESIIQTFEPRILGARVSPRESAGGPGIVFEVTGKLKVDPAPERIRYETVIDPASGDCSVVGDGHA